VLDASPDTLTSQTLVLPASVSASIMPKRRRRDQVKTEKDKPKNTLVSHWFKRADNTEKWHDGEGYHRTIFQSKQRSTNL